MNAILAIASGGAIGALMRHFLNSAVMHTVGGNFPWGIFAANVIGSFVMGMMVTFFALVFEPPQAMRALLVTGMLGAFTTFSTFSLDTALLIERGTYMAATGYVLGSVLVSLGALFAGMHIVRFFAG